MDSLNIDPHRLNISINKSSYILSLCSETLILKQYPVVLGGNPVDDKLRQGDRCTPEGTFMVVTKYEHDKWARFILIDYPNAGSYWKISLAKRDGIIPAVAKPGGSIGIHGVYAGTDYLIDYKINWTLGCISLKNKDIVEIFDYLKTGTKVTILK